MSILKVARMGHPVLRERARVVSKSELRDPLMQKLIDDMIDTMHEYHGVGLAAPQVHEGLRLFVALLDDDPGPKSEATIIVNPEIVPSGSTTEEGWEGCLSIPDISGMVPRFTDITLAALDSDCDPGPIRERLAALEVVVDGDGDGGALAALPASDRFGWVTAPSSTVIQPSEVHTGMTANPKATLDHLFQTLVA